MTRAGLRQTTVRSTHFSRAPLAATLLLFALPCAPLQAGPAGGRGHIRLGLAKFSSFDPLAEVQRLGSLGFDYVEPSLSDLSRLPDHLFAALVARVQAKRISVEAVNCVVPADLRLTGDAVDTRALDAYIETALGRAAALGARVIVLGSGRSRAVPVAFPRARAWNQIEDFLRRCLREIDRGGYQMAIALEPLRREETNILNTVAEALEMVRELREPRVGVAVDYYHFAAEGEDREVLLDAAYHIVHVHVSTRKRTFPTRRDPDVDLRDFLSALQAIRYSGRVSIEAQPRRPESVEREARVARRFLLSGLGAE